MTWKAFPASFFTGLLALILVFTLSVPLSARTQKTTNAAVPNEAAGKPDQTAQVDVAAVKSTGAEKTAGAQARPASVKNADFWFDKGALCATYGNDQAAIKYFQKALALDPNRSDAVFEQGISYGQLGQFDKAVTLVDRAIEMDPENGLYHYGRGRVHLLAGNDELAEVDFQKAARLDDEDAQNYLEIWLR